MDLTFIDPRSPLYEGELDLRFRVLREPLGLTRADVPNAFEHDSLHLVAVDAGRVVGCLMARVEEASARLRQMAVAPALQRSGVGARLVRAMEDELRRRGVTRATLHAREGAVGFYERLGYSVEGQPFVEVGLPHRAMWRSL